MANTKLLVKALGPGSVPFQLARRPHPSRIVPPQPEARCLSTRRGILVGRHVREALSNGSPVVALESTLITHGLPEPQNLELARQLERLVGRPTGEHAGATPATVAIIKGQLKVGLSDEELAYLSQRRLSRPIKASRRDLPVAQALGLSAGTTVAGTMAIVASLAASGRPPIRVFATGGLGGVHKGGELSLDISADLHEMGRTPMAIVSAGFKSFLDTRRTLEYLETMGCTVMSLASEQEEEDEEDDDDERKKRVHSPEGHPFPGFFTRANAESVETPLLVRDLNEAAAIMFHCLEGPLANNRASLLACPIGRAHSLDDYECDGQEGAAGLEALLAQVSGRVDGRPDIGGKEKTPLMLEELNRITGGRTLRANIELLKNNATKGAALAVKYAQLASEQAAIVPPRLHLQPSLNLDRQPAFVRRQQAPTTGKSLVQAAELE